MELNLVLQLTLVLGFLITTGIGQDSSPIVETRFGAIQGVTRAIFDGQRYEEFLGIPYAEPPIGELRFKRTRPWDRTWARPYQATSFGSSCMQDTIFVPKMSEDCLFLNIYRPNVNDSSRRNLLPVLYHIHGGAFQFLSANGENGSLLAASGEMIVVSPNYRLGSLGFAYGDEEEMPGNLGVYDTITALTWVKDNIQSFGGDPDRITVSGQSAGSMIASIFPVVPSLPGRMFQKMFLMSGVSIGDQFMESKHVGLNKTRLLVEKVGCGSIFSSGEPLTKDHIQCLRKIDPRILVKVYPEIGSLGSKPNIIFIPVHGTNLVPEAINQLAWKRSNGTQLEIVIGTEQDEGFGAADGISSLDDAFKQLNESLSSLKKDLTNEEMGRFFNMYFNGGETLSPFELKGKATEFITDNSFHCTSLIYSEIFSRRDRVHGYINTHVFERFGPQQRPYGAQHTDDLLGFFGNPFRDFKGYSDNDRKYSKILMEILTNFITGKEFADWPPIMLNSKSYELDQTVKRLSPEPSNMADTKQKICLEWGKLLGYALPEES